MKKGYDRVIRHSDEFLTRQGYERNGAVYRIKRATEDKVAVFCHQGLGLAWISHLLHIPPPLFWAGFDITHTGVSIFHFKNYPDGFTAPKCLCLSDMSHIYKAGLPLQYNNLLNI
jgi:broad specificity phosphatase PhoE